ncbi:LuxR family transcriptional regulator [Yinghuangia aomiensis]|uniref:LuxR family transcriptional regulator n=1 Tax=Yinghuangia aomiensis TaxID=676205 RepID=A0ABP9HUG6_9ACTN
MTVLPRAEDVFVGRADELSLLTELMDSGAFDHGALVILGEAGIGKSAMLRRFCDAAAETGRRTLRIHCDALLTEEPLGALVDALRNHGVSIDETGGRAQAAVVNALTGLVEDGPLILGIDNLHHLDDASCAALAAALRNRAKHPFSLAAATRGRPQSAGGVGALLDMLDETDRLTTHVVEGLPEDAVAQFLGSAVVEPLPWEAAEVAARTAGNPALIRLLIEDAAHHGSTGGSATVVRADRRKRLLGRFFTPKSALLRFAQAFSVLEPTSAATARSTAWLAGLGADEAEHLFDRLVSEGILEGTQSRCFRFRHAVLRQALRDDIGPATWERWHRDVIALLKSNPEHPALQHDLANLIREIARPGDREAATALVAEAERLCKEDPARSVPWFREALALIPPDDNAHAHVAVRTARALMLAGEPRMATLTGLHALDDLPPGAERTKLAALFVSALMKQGALPEAKRLVQRERRAASRPSLRLASQAAYVYAATGETARADAIVEKAMAYFRRQPHEPDRSSVDERIHALADLIHLRCLSPRGDDILRLMAELEAVAEDGGPIARAGAYATLAFGYSTLGDTGRCAAALDRALPLLPAGTVRPDILVAQARNAVHLGDWDRAITMIESATAVLRSAGMMAYFELLRFSQVGLLVSRGSWAPARELLRTAQTDGAPEGLVDAELAHIDMLSGDTDAARDRLLRRLTTPDLRGTVRLRVLSRLAEVEAQRGSSPGVLAALDKIEGLGLSALDNHTRVIMLLERGHATGDPELVRAGCALADTHHLTLLQARGRLYLGLAGMNADENLREAATMFHLLDALPWRRRTADELRRRGLQVPRPRKKAGGLTPTERQLIQLVGLGKSNRQIATAMALSVKTVEAYLTRLYQKTDCTSRVELARVLDSGSAA